MLKTMPNFALFDPPMKIRGALGKISGSVIETLPMTEPPEYISWSSTVWLLSVVY